MIQHKTISWMGDYSDRPTYVHECLHSPWSGLWRERLGMLVSVELPPIKSPNGVTEESFHVVSNPMEGHYRRTTVLR